jgi:hypothetical protein
MLTVTVVGTVHIVTTNTAVSSLRGYKTVTAHAINQFEQVL